MFPVNSAFRRSLLRFSERDLNVRIQNRVRFPERRGCFADDGRIIAENWNYLPLKPVLNVICRSNDAIAPNSGFVDPTVNQSPEAKVVGLAASLCGDGGIEVNAEAGLPLLELRNEKLAAEKRDRNCGETDCSNRAILDGAESVGDTCVGTSADAGSFAEKVANAND